MARHFLAVSTAYTFKLLYSTNPKDLINLQLILKAHNSYES